MSEITFDNMSYKLVEAIPELRQERGEDLEYWKSHMNMAHIIYGDVLNPFLISLLESGEKEELLKRIFAFLERLANHEDVRVREVVSVTVCERLGNEKEWIERARKYMGPNTLRLCHEVEKFWGRE